MAVINLTIPDATVNRVLTAFAARYGYNAATDGTPSQFTKKQIGIWVRSEVFAHEALVAITAENDARKIEIDSNIPIT